MYIWSCTQQFPVYRYRYIFFSYEHAGMDNWATCQLWVRQWINALPRYKPPIPQLLNFGCHRTAQHTWSWFDRFDLVYLLVAWIQCSLDLGEDLRLDLQSERSWKRDHQECGNSMWTLRISPLQPQIHLVCLLNHHTCNCCTYKNTFYTLSHAYSNGHSHIIMYTMIYI